MRTKAMFCALALACLGPALRAEIVRPSLWGAYSGLSLGRVNEALDQMRADIEGSGAQVSSQSKFGPGWVVGLDLDFKVLPSLHLGPRVEIVQAVDATLEAQNGANRIGARFGGRIIPVLLGAKLARDLEGTGFSYHGGLYLGWGFGSIFNRAELSGGSSTGTYETRYSGSAPVAEFEAGARWRLLPTLSAHVLAGWRWASVPEVKADNDEPVLWKQKAGEVAKDPKGETLPVDFSGWNLGGGLALAF